MEIRKVTWLWVVGIWGICFLIAEVMGHGRLMIPASRNAMWRSGYANPENYDDNQLWCGGATKLIENGGRCGVCGDDFADPTPREHETGGKYANKLVTRMYAPGQKMDVEVELTANHQGYFEFKLCPVKDESQEVTDECLNQLKLPVKNEDGKWDAKYVITTEGPKNFTLRVQLPQTITCSRCVFQWTYQAANTWGTCDNGTEAVGCGPQETFKNCADIAIQMNSGSIPPGTEWPVIITPPENAIYEPETPGDGGMRKQIIVRSQVCVGAGEFKEVDGIDDWCRKNCLRYPQNCPADRCKCHEGCHAIGDFKEKPGADLYCETNCMSNPPKNCTEDRCLCI